ncbi:O-antigen ligase family protein [Candidatus Izemoplasma sp. B36]|uniref:O-antigen ligase family protein n=1 Tax=Candidatus Izemoplasma sp. B36 TaxID=3242468 RepID=UPI003556283D
MQYLKRKNSISQKLDIRDYVSLIVIFYSLFALNRIKSIWSPIIDGFKTTNEIWIYPLIFIIAIIFSKKKFRINKNTNVGIILISFMIILVFLGAFKLESIDQFLYGSAIFLIPIIYLFIYKNGKNRDSIIKWMIYFSIIYSILAIISSFNYASIMSFLGNIVNYQYYDLYRASLMLGSSITVSYYLNISLPLIFFILYKKNTSRIEKLIYITGILLNVIATILLQSRLSTLIMCIIIIYYIFFYDTKVSYKKIVSKVSILSMVIIIIFILFFEFNVDRLIMGFSDSSTKGRIEAMTLFTNIFKKNIFLGSGIGRYYTRIYSYRFIYYDGITSLIDPHNMFILMLSEIGIFGFVTYLLIIINALKRIIKTEDNEAKKTGCLLIFIIFMFSLGGSHLMNEISFSIIVYIYLSVFINSESNRRYNVNENHVYRIS